MKVKEKSEKADLKPNIQNTKIMASGPITSWEIDGETMETVTDFISWAPKSLQIMSATMTLKDTCSLESFPGGSDGKVSGISGVEQYLSAPHGYWCFPGGSDGKESACNTEDPDSIPGLGRSPGVGNGYLL